MPFRPQSACRFRAAVAIVLAIAFAGGCGFNQIQQATLPDQVAGFALADLEAILNNTALTEDEQREAIRDAIGAPDNDDGDRLVNFLFNFNVP